MICHLCCGGKRTRKDSNEGELLFGTCERWNQWRYLRSGRSLICYWSATELSCRCHDTLLDGHLFSIECVMQRTISNTIEPKQTSRINVLAWNRVISNRCCIIVKKNKSSLWNWYPIMKKKSSRSALPFSSLSVSDELWCWLSEGGAHCRQHRRRCNCPTC